MRELCYSFQHLSVAESEENNTTTPPLNLINSTLSNQIQYTNDKLKSICEFETASSSISSIQSTPSTTLEISNPQFANATSISSNTKNRNSKRDYNSKIICNPLIQKSHFTTHHTNKANSFIIPHKNNTINHSNILSLRFKRPHLIKFLRKTSELFTYKLYTTPSPAITLDHVFKTISPLFYAETLEINGDVEILE